MTKEEFKARWDYVQSLLDVDGDIYMGLLTALFIYRILAVVWGQPPVTTAEAAIYSAAVGAFAYSNRGKQ